MPWHTVQQGEWIASIAKQYRFHDWHKIYDHSENSDLRRNRPDPHLLYPGDQVFVPPLDVAEYPCATDKLHTFRLETSKTKLVIVAKNEEDKPIASKPYKLTLNQKSYSGTTDANGKLEQEIAEDPQQGVLEVEGYLYDVRVGHLDPIETLMGVQERLTNLGYDCSPIDGTANEQTIQAITQFQQEMNLKPTGDLNDATRTKLKEKYGC